MQDNYAGSDVMKQALNRYWHFLSLLGTHLLQIVNMQINNIQDKGEPHAGCPFSSCSSAQLRSREQLMVVLGETRGQTKSFHGPHLVSGVCV